MLALSRYHEHKKEKRRTGGVCSSSKGQSHARCAPRALTIDDPLVLRPATDAEVMNEPLFFRSSDSAACATQRWDMTFAV